MKNILRIRTENESNYRAIFSNGITLRYQIRDNEPISELIFPEFYDVKITSKCSFGKCPFCYMSSSDNCSHVMDALDKIDSFFKPLTMNQRPFQVALGGGETTEHPHFAQILEKFDSLKIVPNYTTNGTLLCDMNKNTEEILNATQKYCGGVAVSCHPHLRDKWEKAIKNISKLKDIKLSFHHIIFDIASVDTFFNIFNSELDAYVNYHVLLPLVAQGRSNHGCKSDAVKYLFDKLEQLPADKQKKASFGAKFYEDLINHKNKLPGISLYDPEGFSKFLDLKDMKIYGSSFESNIV